MTVLSPAQIVGLALPGLAPSSSGRAGAGLGAPISVDWRDARIASDVRTGSQRRKAIAKARAAVEARADTKAERLAKGQSSRDTGSERERVATRNSVAKAAAALADVPSDKEFSTAEFRRVKESLRQLYPGAKLSAILTEAARLEQMLLDDPVAAHQSILAAYSRTKGSAAFVEPTFAKGLRGSLQRARIDQEDAADLKDWITRYGKRLPAILAEIEATDRALRSNPNFEGAKLAARHGAPAIESEVPAYEAKQAQKAQAKRHEMMHQNILRGINLAIKEGIIDGDPGHLKIIAEVMSHKNFPWAEHHKHGQHANFSALTHADRVAKQMRAQQGKVDAGLKSIHGAPGAGQGGRAPRGDKGSGSARDSIARVRAVM